MVQMLKNADMLSGTIVYRHFTCGEEFCFKEWEMINKNDNIKIAGPQLII